MKPRSVEIEGSVTVLGHAIMKKTAGTVGLGVCSPGRAARGVYIL